MSELPHRTVNNPVNKETIIYITELLGTLPSYFAIIPAYDIIFTAKVFNDIYAIGRLDIFFFLGAFFIAPTISLTSLVRYSLENIQINILEALISLGIILISLEAFTINITEGRLSVHAVIVLTFILFHFIYLRSIIYAYIRLRDIFE